MKKLVEIATLTFETGNLSEFTETRGIAENGNILEASQENAYLGSWALKLTCGGLNGVVWGKKDFPQQAGIHMQFALYIDPSLNIPEGKYLKPFTPYKSATRIIFMDIYQGYGTQWWLKGIGWTGAVGTGIIPALEPGVWHIIDIYFSAAILGYAEIWYDSVKVWESGWSPDFNTSGNEVNRVYVGNYWGSAETTGIVFFDDILVEDWIPPPPPPMPPVAKFHALPWRQTPGQVVTFDASESYDSDGTVVSWSWDFGDGTIGEGEIVTHTYGAEGEYRAFLTVTDSDGLTSTAGSVIIISTAPIIVVPSALHTEGRWTKDNIGEVVVLFGVNKGGLHESEGGRWHIGNSPIYYFDRDSMRNELDTMKSWGANYVRLVVAIDYWRFNMGNHREVVKEIVQYANSIGMYVIYCPYLVHHYPPQKQERFPFPPWVEEGEYGSDIVASEDDYVNYLTHVASKLVRYPNVIFEIYNEPCVNDQYPYWRDPELRSNWFNMNQKFINNLRNDLGSDHLVIVSWGVILWYPVIDLSWIPTCGLTGGNIIYNNHVYKANLATDYATLKSQLAEMKVCDIGVAYNKPLMFNEVGADKTNPEQIEFFRTLLKILNEWNISYGGWSWRPDLNIVLLADWEGTPNVCGQILIDAIAEALPPTPIPPYAIILVPLGIGTLILLLSLL